MSQSEQNQIINNKNQENCWKCLYKIAGIAILFSVLVGIVEVIINFFPLKMPENIIDWFMLLQKNPFMGLRNLGLLNLMFIPMGLFTFLALYGTHRKVNKPFSILAMIISLVSIIVFLATNRAFVLLDLSNQYAAATTDTQRSVLMAAGQAVLSVGRGHSPGTFIGFLLGNMAGIVISIVMFRGKVFTKLNALLGIIGFALLLIFEICCTFLPVLGDLGTIVSMIGGLLAMVWHILIALKLFRFARLEKREIS